MFAGISNFVRCIFLFCLFSLGNVFGYCIIYDKAGLSYSGDIILENDEAVTIVAQKNGERITIRKKNIREIIYLSDQKTSLPAQKDPVQEKKPEDIPQQNANHNSINLTTGYLAVLGTLRSKLPAGSEFSANYIRWLFKFRGNMEFGLESQGALQTFSEGEYKLSSFQAVSGPLISSPQFFLRGMRLLLAARFGIAYEIANNKTESSKSTTFALKSNVYFHWHFLPRCTILAGPGITYTYSNQFPLLNLSLNFGIGASF